jgi:hypothetical protein
VQTIKTNQKFELKNPQPAARVIDDHVGNADQL